MKAKVVYCTIAVGQQYRDISLRLIKTFLDNVHPKGENGSVLHIFTDAPEDYNNDLEDQGVFIDIIKLDETRLPNFDLNVKGFLLDLSYLLFLPDYIVLHDCDLFIANPVDQSWFDLLPEGISVVFGDQGVKQPLRYWQNMAIYEKALELSSNYTAEFYTFKEGTLLLNLKDGEKFLKFTDQWQRLYHEVAEKQLVDCAQVHEINLASERSGFALHNLGTFPLRNCFFYHERNGAIGPALV